MKNKTNKYDIGDDEIFIMSDRRDPWYIRFWWVWIVVAVILAIVILFFVIKPQSRPVQSVKPYVPQMCESATPEENVWFSNTDAKLPSCTVVKDTVIDSVPLLIYTPYNFIPELYIGHPDTADTDIIFAALAADIRGDNGKIVGAYVYNGEPLSWGLSKKGYCALIDGSVAIGVAENSPFFEQAIEQGGYFFRQYAAVDNGIMVENNPQNAAFRRALCVFDNKVCIVVSAERMKMNAFSESLVKLGVENGIFLVGTDAAGWYRDEHGSLFVLGEKAMKGAKNINYIVFRAQ